MWPSPALVPHQKCNRVHWWARRAACKKGRQWSFDEREGEEKLEKRRQSVGERLLFVFIAPLYDKRFAASEVAASERGVGGCVDGVARKEPTDQLWRLWRR